MSKIGDVIDGKYEILKEVGRGGMSIVYLAMDNRLNKQWAVKEIKKKGSNSQNQIVVQSLLAEANLMKGLDHPNLPRIVDIIDVGQTIWIVMDYIEGEPLDKILKHKGAQSQEAVIEWGRHLAEVLDYLHTRKPPIIYRDMKPANIMLRPDGSIKLIDFGIAREYKENNSADTVSLGTKGYAAPEQFGGMGQTDARTDVYCLGVTLYHLVTGKNPCEPPYEIMPIRTIDPKLSSGLEVVIQKCTQMNPDDRFQSCAEVLYALEHLEEFDGRYRKKQKSKLAGFIAAAACTLIMAAAGIGCHFGYLATISAQANDIIKEYGYEGQQNIDTLYAEMKDIEQSLNANDCYNYLSDACLVVTEDAKALIEEINELNDGSTDDANAQIEEKREKINDEITALEKRYNECIDIVETNNLLNYCKLNDSLAELYLTYYNYQLDEVEGKCERYTEAGDLYKKISNSGLAEYDSEYTQNDMNYAENMKELSEVISEFLETNPDGDGGEDFTAGDDICEKIVDLSKAVENCSSGKDTSKLPVYYIASEIMLESATDISSADSETWITVAEDEEISTGEALTCLDYVSALCETYNAEVEAIKESNSNLSELQNNMVDKAKKNFSDIKKKLEGDDE